jgi:hypothetical protein
MELDPYFVSLVLQNQNETYLVRGRVTSSNICPRTKSSADGLDEHQDIEEEGRWFLLKESGWKKIPTGASRDSFQRFPSKVWSYIQHAQYGKGRWKLMFHLTQNEENIFSLNVSFDFDAKPLPSNAKVTSREMG